MAVLCAGLHLSVAWRDERVPTMCVQRLKVLFVLADTPALLTFLHIIHSHSCIAWLNAVGVRKLSFL